MAWAVAQPCKNSGQKLVLLMLANHANGHTGQCNPSHKRLADECCMGVSTLKVHISGLAELGYVSVIANSRDGVSLPNQYVLMHSQIAWGVGQNLAGGGSESGRGVGQNLATEPGSYEPGIEPKTNTPPPPKGGADPDGFAEFWATWPQSQRKVARKQCSEKWRRNRYSLDLAKIIAHVESLKHSKQWTDGYEPSPLTYLNQERWKDGAPINQSAESGYI